MRLQNQSLNFSAVLLAGGESRRMGTNKANLVWNGEPLWQRQLELLRCVHPLEIFVSARAQPSWLPNDATFVADIPPSRGPLSGLTAALAKTRTSHLLALAVDMPLLTTDWVCRICDKAAADYGVVPIIGGRAEPLAAAYPINAYPDFCVALDGQDFSLQTLTARLVAAGKLLSLTVEAPDERFFRSVNTPSDLERLAREEIMPAAK